jgi:hypothetical protein
MNRPARYVLPIVLLAILASCGTESDPPAKATATSTSSANHRDDIEVLDAVLVMNDDGSATLSARIVNHTDADTKISRAYLRKDEEASIRVFPANKDVIHAGGEATTGGVSDPVRIRVPNAPETDATIPVSLEFDMDEPNYRMIAITISAPVVERSPAYETVAGNKPNTEIKVVGAKIVVVHGQKKAYVGGATTGSITDTAWELPTATDAKGNPVQYRHQTATGGPYEWLVEAGKTIPFGGPPWVVSEDEPQGDADYFNAKDVKVGETITVTIPFQSGDVVAPFKVVAG